MFLDWSSQGGCRYCFAQKNEIAVPLRHGVLRSLFKKQMMEKYQPKDFRSFQKGVNKRSKTFDVKWNTSSVIISEIQLIQLGKKVDEIRL